MASTGGPARPHAETRIVWGGDYLYLALYAADEDIETHTEKPDDTIAAEDDAFRLVFSQPGVEYAIEVTPLPIITDARRVGSDDWDVSWDSGSHASREIDGTINDPRNRDEEWAVELAIPLASLGMRGERGANIGLTISRCDVLKGTRVCSAWGAEKSGRGKGRLVLD